MNEATMIKGKISMKNLTVMLQSALDKENESWKPICYLEQDPKEDEVGFEERNERVRWFLRMNEQFKFNPETVVLCVAIFDHFMYVVKVKSKYTECIAAACFFLAVKTMEEDETIPTTSELVEQAGCKCSVSDVLRMEKIILQKLSWNTKLVTSLDFLHIMHGLLVLNHKKISVSPGRQLSSLTRKLHACLTSHRLLIFSPSSIALALLSLELQLCTNDWLALTIMMQQLIKLNNRDLIYCREVISDVLSNLAMNARVKTTVKRSSSPVNKPSKRKVEQIDVEDDIYDSIKRLYGDDTPSTCATQAVQASMTAHGFLQVPAT